MARLKAASGTTEANVGTTDYIIPPDGIIDVPDSAVDDLVSRGGFTPVTAPPAPVDGTAIMRAPDANASFTYAGVSYSAGVDGVLTVPVEAVSAMVSHGFTVVSG